MLNLHIRNPHIKSDILAKTESLVIHVFGKIGFKPHVGKAPAILVVVISTLSVDARVVITDFGVSPTPFTHTFCSLLLSSFQ